MNDPFIHFHRPSIGEEEINEVVETLRSGWLTTGPSRRSLRARLPRVHRRAPRGCGEFGHRRVAPRAGGPEDRPGRRSDHHADDILRHRAGHPARGRHAGAGRYRMGRQHRPGGDRQTHHEPNAGDHAGAHGGTALRHDAIWGLARRARYSRDRRRGARGRSTL